MTQSAPPEAQASGLDRRSDRWKRIPVLILLCGITFVLYPLLARLYLGTWTFPFDDPWTHQVYARNLAWHGQYAFNLGEPSTGSSAPLWTLLMVPAYWLGLPPVPWALAWGLLSLAGLGAAMWAWAERRLPAPLPPLLTAAALLSPQIAWAGLEGMETALAAALGLVILCRLDRPRWLSGQQALLDGLLNGLLLWLRPEAPLLTLVVAWQRRRQGWRFLLSFAVGFLLPALLYAGFHLAISGQPLPQTVYAKAAYYGQSPSLSSAIAFLGTFALIFAPGVWPLAALLALLALRSMARRREWPWGPGLAWAGMTVLVAAVRLPAVLHFGRHFVPVLPPLLLASGEALRSLPQKARWAAMVLGGCLLLIGLVVGVGLYLPLCRGIEDTQVAMGQWMADPANLPQGVPVATHDIGAIGYFGQHPVVDTLALVTPELTSIVASDDTTALLAYLQQQGVHYIAILEEMYPGIRQGAGARLLIKQGRMVLLHLP